MPTIRVNDQDLEVTVHEDGHLTVNDNGVIRSAERADLPDAVETYNPDHPQAPLVHKVLKDAKP